MGSFEETFPRRAFFYDLLYASQTLRYCKVFWPFFWTDAHYDLIAQHFEESSNLFHQQFPNSRFIVVFWDAGVTRDPLLSRLSRAGIEVVDMGMFVKQNIYEPKGRAWSIEGDGHPLPRVYDAFAREIVTQLKINE